MRTIRTCVFETNSSSCHVLSICKESVYNDFFNKGIGLWSGTREEIMTFEEAIEELKKDYNDACYQKYFRKECSENYEPDPDKIFTVKNLKKVIKENKTVHGVFEDLELENGIEDDETALLYWLNEDYFTAEEWAQQDWIEESFDQTYTTDSGEKIVAFGYYGHD